MSGVDAPAPWRIAFDNARDPYTARNALGAEKIGGGGGGGGTAPDSAEYIVAATDPTLTAERVLTNTASITWDFTTPGQAKANTASGGGNVSNVGTPTLGQYAKWTTATTIQGVNAATVLGDIGAQPLDADLTALAALTGTSTIYYRSAANTWSPVTVSTGLSFTGGVLTATGGGGNVSNSGTPTSGQWARWTTATTIEGVAAASTGFVLKTGDTMSGALTVNAAFPELILGGTTNPGLQFTPSSGGTVSGNFFQFGDKLQIGNGTTNWDFVNLATGAFSAYGTTDGSNAAAGYVGEYLETASASSVPASTFTAITAIGFPAGDWDIWAAAEYQGGSSGARAFISVSTSAGAFGPLGNTAMTVIGPGLDAYPCTSPVRISIPSTTTIYAVALSDANVTTVTAKLAGRRVR